MLVALYRLELKVEVEGLYQFLEYDRDRLAEAVEYLFEIGAKDKAEILKQLAVLDVDLGDKFDAVASRWQSGGEDSAALLQEYCRSHRPEFDAMLRNRAALRATTSIGRPSDDALLSQAYSGGPAALNGYEQFLLEPARLALLLRLAADAHCPSRTKALTALYAIAGSIGTDGLAQKPASLKELTNAISAAKSRNDAGLELWAEDVRKMLDSPDPETLLLWMGALFNHD